MLGIHNVTCQRLPPLRAESLKQQILTWYKGSQHRFDCSAKLVLDTNYINYLFSWWNTHISQPGRASARTKSVSVTWLNANHSSWIHWILASWGRGGFSTICGECAIISLGLIWHVAETMNKEGWQIVVDSRSEWSYSKTIYSGKNARLDWSQILLWSYVHQVLWYAIHSHHCGRSYSGSLDW